MKRNYISILFFFFITFGFAQIPAGYYNNATGTGYTLKTQLYNIISPHTTLTYTPGLWNLYYTSDIRPDGKVWDIYANCNFIFGTFAFSGGNQDDGTGGTAECQKYNREHSFPKSWFSGLPANYNTPMYSDAFHVMPADKKVNGLRGNMAYGKVGTATYTSGNGCKIGNCVAPNYPYAQQVFEPADQYKGDLARNYFYMATCYQNIVSNWQKTTIDGDTVLDGSSDKVYEQWYLDLMYSWHIADPVSTKEIDRNNEIYKVQGNRNPFIDHPEWVQTIWGNNLNIYSFNDLENSVCVYPVPTNNHSVNIESNDVLNDIQIINLNGQLIQEIKKPASQNNLYTLENLPQGFYFLKLTSDTKFVTKQIIVN